MSQNNARKSPFKSNENLQQPSKGNVSSSKLESLRSQENQSGYTPQLKRVQNMQQNRSQNSQSAHAPRSNSNNPVSNISQSSLHNQSVAHAHNISNHSMAMNPHRNENILCAVLALIKELNESELELIKRDIDKKLTTKSKH